MAGWSANRSSPTDLVHEVWLRELGLRTSDGGCGYIVSLSDALKRTNDFEGRIRPERDLLIELLRPSRSRIPNVAPSRPPSATGTGNPSPLLLETLYRT